MLADPHITKVLSADVVKEAFDLKAQLRNVGTIFDRVFGQART